MRRSTSRNTRRRRSGSVFEGLSYCSWTVRQDKPGAMKVRCFKCFVGKMNGLTQKNDGIRGKASEVGKQLRDRVLEACCEEQIVKLSRQEERAMEEERAKKKRVQQGGPGGRSQGRKQGIHGRKDQVGGCGRRNALRGERDLLRLGR